MRPMWARQLCYTCAPRNSSGQSPMPTPQATNAATEARPAVRVLEVGEAADGQRLDNFLHARLKGAPKSLVYRIIRSGEVRVNGKRARAESRLAAGDAVRVPPLRLADSDPSPLPSAELGKRLKDAVLYQDAHLMVLNKPAGLAVHSGTGMRLGLVEALRALFPEYPGLELVHRLDKGTSGCVLLALDGRTRRELSDAFRSREVGKRYELLVAGRWPERLKFVDSALQRQPERAGERRVEVDPEGKSALTRFRILKQFRRATWLEALPETGRTHQIRVHAAASGYPLLGDDKYGTPASAALDRDLGVRRLCLHAASLQFRHPVSGKELRVEAPHDAVFTALLERLATAG